MKDLKRDKDGRPTDDDLKAYLFRKADKNKDRWIDRKEWEEFYDSVMEPGGESPHHPHRDRR